MKTLVIPVARLLLATLVPVPAQAAILFCEAPLDVPAWALAECYSRDLHEWCFVYVATPGSVDCIPSPL